MDNLEYGIVKEYSDYDLWYEPITDEIDELVLRYKNGMIFRVFSENKKQSDFTWDGSGD